MAAPSDRSTHLDRTQIIHHDSRRRYHQSGVGHWQQSRLGKDPTTSPFSNSLLPSSLEGVRDF